MNRSNKELDAEILERERDETTARTKPHNKRAHRTDTAAQLAEMNAKYCVVQHGQSVDVLMFKRHTQMVGAYQHVRHVPTFLSFESLRNKHCNHTVLIAERKNGVEMTTPKMLGHWWLKHPQRRQYDGVTFRPGGTEVIDNHLNLWKGWGVEPKRGDWSLMREHIYAVLAASDEVADDYIMNWLAWCVQHPDQRAEVALVLKGKRGSGKGTLGNAVMRLFGQHAIHISSADHLAGRFNFHLRDACFLFADEAYWPGNRSAEGALKRLITEPTLFIEGKNRNGELAANMLHVMMASNEDWVVPAGERERRYATFEASECHVQDESWFGPLYAQLDDGGYAAMLFDLLRRDIAGWHPRRLPKTGVALLEQQRLSLPPLDSWWVELLESGTLDGTDPLHPNRAVSNTYDREIVETDGYGGTRTRYVKQRGLYDQARSIEPRLRHHTSDHALGHFLSEQGCVSRKALRRRGWWFPDLLKARKAWETRFPGWSWRSPEIKAWSYPEDGDDADDQADDPDEASH
jgi:hypothetical protein